MGQTLACACLEDIIPDSLTEDTAAKERLEVLKKGDKFTRSAYLGLSSQEMTVNLSDDSSTIKWKTEKSWGSGTFGEIDLTSEVKKVKSVGETGLQFVGQSDTPIFEMKASDAATRDKWIVALSELLQGWEEDPRSKPKAGISAAGTSDKTEYFKKREEEIKAREKVNAERKAKFSVNGMPMTAQIMAASK
ncbi:hypothetical protein EON65_35325 [archaeon]|nr:MAG: hypothetical protein EON65_35325 [archaeon]